MKYIFGYFLILFCLFQQINSAEGKSAHDLAIKLLGAGIAGGIQPSPPLTRRSSENPAEIKKRLSQSIAIPEDETPLENSDKR